MALDNENLIVSFNDKSVKIFSLKKYSDIDKRFYYLMKNKYVNKVNVQTGGYGIIWDDNFVISNSVLYKQGEKRTMTIEIMDKWRNDVLTTSEVMKELNCSRQYVNELINKNKLHPIKSLDKTTLFSKSEVIKLNWN